MKILTIDDGCKFLIRGTEIKPEELSKNDLLNLFLDIYDLEEDEKVDLPEEDEINSINNPVEREIINQIIQKVVEYLENLDQIKKEVESSFTNLSNRKD